MEAVVPYRCSMYRQLSMEVKSHKEPGPREASQWKEKAYTL